MKSILLIIIVFFGILFSLNLVSAASPSLPAHIIYYIPVNIINTQSTAIAANTPIAIGTSSTGSIIGFNALPYSSYFTQNNFEFFYANGTIIPSWLEAWNTSNEISSSLSSNMLEWINLGANTPNELPASMTSNYIIYMGWAGNVVSSSNTLFNNVNTGEAPQLSPSYAEYDDGAVLFPTLYQNFNGTTTPSGFVVTGSTVTQNNGISAYSASGEVNIATSANYGDNSLQIYDSLTDFNSSNGVGEYTVIGYGAPSSEVIAINNQGTNEFSFSGSSVGSGSFTTGQYYVFSLYSPSSGTSATGQINYGTVYSGTTPATAYPLYPVRAYTAGSTTGKVTTQWIRIRTYPPNGVMPTTTFGAIQTAPLSVSITPSSATYNKSQSVSIKAYAVGGTSPYTYQWYNDTSGTGVAISGATSATFTETAGATVQTVKYYVKVTDSASSTATSSIGSYVITIPSENCDFAGAWEKNYYNRICFSSINYTGYVSGNDIGNVTYWYMNLSKINFQGLLGKTYDFMGYNGSSTIGNVTAYPFSEGYLLRNTTIYNESYNGLVFYYNSSSFVPTYYYANYSESQANNTINSNSSISKTNYYTYGASSSSGTYLPIISYLNPSFNYTGVKWSSNTLSLNRTYGFTFSLGSTPYYIYETSPNTDINFKVHYVTPCGNVYNEYYNYTGGLDYTYKITSAFFDIWPIKQVFSVIGTALFSVYEPNLPSSCSLISIPNVYPYFSYSPIGSSGIGIYANGTIFNTTVSKTPYLTGSFGLSNRVNLLVSVSNVAIPNDTIVIVPAYSTTYLNSTVQSNSTPINYKKNITSFPCYQNGQFCYEYRNLISHINWNFTLNTSTQTEALTNKSSCTNCVFTGLTPVWHYFNETSTYLEVKLPNYNISTVKGSTIPSCRFMFFDDYNMSTHTDYGKVNYTTTTCNIHNNTATFILQNYTSDNVVIGSNASDNQIWDYWYNIENVSLGLPSSSVTSNFILANVKPNSLYSLPHNQSSPSIPTASAVVTFNRSLLYGSFVKWNESTSTNPNNAYGSIGYVTNTLIGADSGFYDGTGCYSDFYDYNTSGYAKNEYEYLILGYEGGTEPTPSIIGSSLGAYVGTGTGSTGANMGDSNQTAYVKGCGDPTYGGIVNVQTVKGISATVSRLYSTHYFRSPKILTLNVSINQTICPVNFPTCNSGTGVNATSPLINSTSSGYISNASVFGNYTQTEKSLSYTFNLFGITMPYWAMFPFMIIALIVLAFSFMFNNDYLPLIIALAYLLSGLLNFIFYGNLGLFGISIIGIIYVAYYISSNLPKWLHGK